MTGLWPDPPLVLVENIRVALKEHLYPEFFMFIFNIIDERLQPLRMPAERSTRWPLCDAFDDDFLMA